MKVFQRFPFLLGLLASLFVLLSFKVKSPSSSINQELAILGVLLGIVYWIKITLCIHQEAKHNQHVKRFWMVMTIAAPFLGGMLYQIFHERNLLEADHPQPSASEMAA